MEEQLVTRYITCYESDELCNWAAISQTSVNYDFLVASSSGKLSLHRESNLNTEEFTENLAVQMSIISEQLVQCYKKFQPPLPSIKPNSRPNNSIPNCCESRREVENLKTNWQQSQLIDNIQARVPARGE